MIFIRKPSCFAFFLLILSKPATMRPNLLELDVERNSTTNVLFSFNKGQRHTKNLKAFIVFFSKSRDSEKVANPDRIFCCSHERHLLLRKF